MIEENGNIDEYEEEGILIEDGEEQDKYLDRKYLDTIYDTVTWSSDWTIESIFNQLSRKNIDLDPGFQRRDAWNKEKKSLFIESLFLGLPVPQLVLAESKSSRGKFIVVDGKQRLTTIYQFLNGDFKVRNTNLDFINGKKYEELKQVRQDATDFLLNQTIRSVILKNWSSDDLLYAIFYRLNSGSLPLSPQELRAALKPGPLMEAIANYTESSSGMKSIFKKRHPDPRMKDVELLLRFISFVKFSHQYDGNYKEFLDKTCDYFNANWGETKDEFFEICSQFELSVDTSVKAYGDCAFKRFNKGKWENRFSRAVFDIQTFIARDENCRDVIIKNKDILLKSFMSLCSGNASFNRSISTNTNNLQNTLTRFSLFAKEVEKITGLTDLLPESMHRAYGEKYAQS